MVKIRTLFIDLVEIISKNTVPSADFLSRDYQLHYVKLLSDLPHSENTPAIFKFKRTLTVLHHVHLNKIDILMHTNVTSRSLNDLDILYNSITYVILKNLIEDYGFCDVITCSWVSIYDCFGETFWPNFSVKD
jgi:hypothetical protein